MARVSFTALVEEIVGKLAGTVFQDSYGGYQIRTRVSPRNPRSQFQQLRRGEFAYLKSGWRDLEPWQRETWRVNAPEGMQALNFYVRQNINLTLIHSPTVAAYESSTPPVEFPFETGDFFLQEFKIYSMPYFPVVPEGFKLLLQATQEREPQQLFNNPSMFSPILSIPGGTDFSSGLNILPEWRARYGQPRPDKRICIKAALVNIYNGDRGPEYISCAVTTQESANLIIDSAAAALVDSDGTFITYPD